MRRFESASPEVPLSPPSHLFSLFANSRDVLLSVVPSLMAGSLFFLLLLTFLLLLLLVFICRPWRFFRRCSRPSETHEITRPLFYENFDDFPGQSNCLARRIDDQKQVIQIDDNESSISNHSFVSRKRSYSLEPAIIQEGRTLLDYENVVHEVGNNLNKTAVTSWYPPDPKHLKQHGRDFTRSFKEAKFPQISTLSLEVTSGLSSGLRMSITSATHHAVLTIGRVPTNNLVLNDSEVSARHAIVKFNCETQKWEITDLGSLNGTYLNSTAIHHPDVGSRNFGFATALSNEDVITFGNSSNVLVHITNSPIGRVEGKAPNQILPNHNLQSLGIGMASDPMAKRLGGKKLPMEDFGLLQYPLPGVEKFGLLGVFDGHGGSGAAETASRTFPENIVKVLSQSGEQEKVFSSSDASGILRQAFALTEAQMKHHEYEGCTATALLMWSGSDGDLFAQCANLGDSECVIYVEGREVIMTEEHKVNSAGERNRIAQTGNPLKDGESRIHGLNLCRMLGDSFIKGKDQRFIAEPYVSKVHRINRECAAFALVASHGLWDVLTKNQAVKFVLENKERMKGQENYAELIAQSLVREAALKRTKDNTTVVFVDFDNLRTYLFSTSN